MIILPLPIMPRSHLLHCNWRFLPMTTIDSVDAKTAKQLAAYAEIVIHHAQVIETFPPAAKEFLKFILPTTLGGRDWYRCVCWNWNGVVLQSNSYLFISLGLFRALIMGMIEYGQQGHLKRELKNKFGKQLGGHQIETPGEQFSWALTYFHSPCIWGGF